MKVGKLCPTVKNTNKTKLISIILSLSVRRCHTPPPLTYDPSFLPTH